MHPEDIKAAIRKRGKTQTSIANDLNVSVMAVCQVVRGSSKSARIARRISELTGLQAKLLWPGAYPDIESEQSAPSIRMNQRAGQRR